MVPVTAVRDLGLGDGPQKMCFGLCGGGANSGIGPCRNRDWGEELCGGRSGPEEYAGRTWVEFLSAVELGEGLAYMAPGNGPLGGAAVPCPPSTCEAWGIPCDDCFEPDAMKRDALVLAAPSTVHECQQPVVPIAATVPSDDPDEYPNDAAVWHNSADPAKSIIFGTDRGRHRNPGHIWAFDLDGGRLYTVNVSNPYHVDVEYGLTLGGTERDIVVSCERENQYLRVWAVETDGSLSPTDGCPTVDGGDCGLPIFSGETSGSCNNAQLYKRPSDGAVFAIIGRDQARGSYHRGERAKAGRYDGESFTPFNFAQAPSDLTMSVDGVQHTLSLDVDIPDIETAARVLQDAADSVILTAFIRSADIQGTVSFAANSDGTGVTVTANLLYTDESWPVTTTGHKWHIHAGNLTGVDPTDCNCDNDDDISQCAQPECPQCYACGGHYDPTGLEGSLFYSCDPGAPEACYAGDLSGKFGTLSIAANPEEISPPPMVADLVGVDTSLDLEQLIGRTIVIHQAGGNADRIACGTIRSAVVVEARSGEDEDAHLRVSSQLEAGTSMVDIPASSNYRNRNARALFGGGIITQGSASVPSYREEVAPIDGSYVWQYQLQDFDADGIVEATKVREFGAVQAHDIAVDDEAGVIYIIGYSSTYQVPADPDAYPTVTRNRASFGGDGLFERYRYGGSVWNARGEAKMSTVDQAGYVLIGDANNNTVQAFCRSDNDIPPPIAEAIIDGDGFSGKVTFTESLDGVELYASIKYSGSHDERTLGHKWHIHTNAADPEDCASAGGHYDPAGLGTSPSYICNASAGYSLQDQCYLGDMSGKFGPLTIGERGDDYNRYRPAPPATGLDTTLDVRTLVGKSIVIHAADGDSTRIACATINAGIPDASTYAGKVALSGVEYSAGHEVSSEDFGDDLDQGIVVVMSDRTHNFLIFNWKDVGACLAKELCGVQAISSASHDDGEASDYVGKKNGPNGALIAGGIAIVVIGGVIGSRWKAAGAKEASDKASDSIYAEDPDLSPA